MDSEIAKQPNWDQAEKTSNITIENQSVKYDYTTVVDRTGKIKSVRKVCILGDHDFKLVSPLSTVRKCTQCGYSYDKMDQPEDIEIDGLQHANNMIVKWCNEAYVGLRNGAIKKQKLSPDEWDGAHYVVGLLISNPSGTWYDYFIKSAKFTADELTANSLTNNEAKKITKSVSKVSSLKGRIMRGFPVESAELDSFSTEIEKWCQATGRVYKEIERK